ncbi:MAG TPA: DUF1684 domain-containing protein [Opitutaceae bacterium]
MKKALPWAAWALVAATSLGAGGDYPSQILADRSERVSELTRADGWLTLIGLHFLDAGANTVGSAAANRIVLAAGPRQFGTVTLSGAGAATFTAAPGAEVSIDGKPATSGVLQPDGLGTRHTLVASGTVSFFLLERGGRLALRVRDSEAERRTHFLGLDYFPIDPSWRIEAQWVPFDPPREIPITNVLGNVSREKATGKAVFQRGGRTYELTPVVEGPGEPLFFIFADLTSDVSTYHMRFLDADQPKDGKVVLDFNLTETPPCGFTPFATCPLPPKENHLDVAVTSGEKSYRGRHE